MTDAAPYREGPRYLLCPRCGDLLERAFDAVHVCMRCEGVWIPPLSLEKAFGDPQWPGGRNAWWRNVLACPECATEGSQTTLSAVTIGSLIADRCHSQGLWLDRGELGRLMGGSTADDRGDDDLAALRERLRASEGDLEQLLELRQARRAERDRRAQLAAEYRDWLDAQQQRRRDQATRAEQEASTRRAVEAAERALDDARRDHERTLARVREAQAEASAHVARMETEVAEQRAALHASEAKLEGARVRLRAIDDELAALERRNHR